MSLDGLEGRGESSSKSDKLNPKILGLICDTLKKSDCAVDIENEPLKDPLFYRGDDGGEYKTFNELTQSNGFYLNSIYPTGNNHKLITDNHKRKQGPKIHIPSIYLN